MGRFECPVHGDSWMGLVCGHLRAAVLGSRTVGRVTRAKFVDHDEPNYGGTLYLFYCATCIAEHNLPQEDNESSMEHYREMDRLGFYPVCWECFDDTRRRSSELDP